MEVYHRNSTMLVECMICGSTDLKGYDVHFGALSNAGVNIGWCSKHETEGKEKFREMEGRAMESKFRMSGS